MKKKTSCSCKSDSCQPKSCSCKSDSCQPKTCSSKSCSRKSYTPSPPPYCLPTSKPRQFTSIEQESVQGQLSAQILREKITLECCSNVSVTTAQTQALLSLQGAIQAVIVLVVNILVIDDNKAAKLSQDLIQLSASKQVIEQEITVIDSEDCQICAIDTQVAVQVQLLLQLLLALLIQIGVIAR